ncbi:cobalamin biosynthesis protein [Methylobacterium oryzae]|uniref:cobalamin biosynthesis protein n=1 Tax=Methylobacterium oryzae TaxID=334852 RepID=UPI002F35DC13
MTGALVAGIGFRRGTDADEIAELIERALALVGAARSSLAAVATADDRASDPAPHPIAAAALEARDAEIVTRSARVERLRGVGSVAEAAALAGAGSGSRLALPRIASGGATCALAVRYDTTRES